MKLEELLAEVYRLKAGRQESDVGMSEPYWDAVTAFRQAHARAGHVAVDSAKAKEIAGIKVHEMSVDEIPVPTTVTTENQPTARVKTTDEQLAELGLL